MSSFDIESYFPMIASLMMLPGLKSAVEALAKDDLMLALVKIAAIAMTNMEQIINITLRKLKNLLARSFSP